MHTLYEVSSSSEDENNEEELAKSFDQQVLQVCTAYSHAGEKDVQTLWSYFGLCLSLKTKLT